MTASGITTTRLGLFGFFAILLLAWFCYLPALSGDFQLDDRSNLAGLASVEDAATATDFVFSGTAGPTGRPLALFTFVLQADQWEQGAEAFLRVNVLIHVLNAVLLAACLYLLTLAQGASRDRSVLIATLAAGCWVLMPLLATSSMLVVQRMLTLSATFTLIGLLGYLLARRHVEANPRPALIWMGVSLVLGTVLGMLSKETGILLPVYVLAIEATLLSAPKSISRRQWRILQGLFLGVPAAVILGYLAAKSAYPEWVIAWRGFSGWERLLTEAQLLWVYLKKALVGLPSTLGVYQPTPAVARGLLETPVFLSILTWVLVAGAAIRFRHRWPLFSFAVAWYIGGHLLESTVLSLELYFEHRNYLPIVGPVYAVFAALVLGSRRSRRVTIALAPLYLLLSAALLYQFASIMGQPSASSRYWANRYPDSVRAVTMMATYQLEEEGPLQTLTTLDQFVLRHPQHSYLRIQELNLRCLAMPDADHGEVVEQLRRDLPRAEFTRTAGTMLSQLFDTVSARDCNGVDTQTLLDIADSLLANPGYALVPDHVQFHYRLLAGIARQQGRIQEAITYLETAMAVQKSSELNMMMVTALGDAGEYDRARSFIDDAMAEAPLNPLRAFAWRRDLENLREYINELERYSELQE